MKQFLIQYLHILGYTICGLLFAFSSFYLIINFYHQKELQTYYVVNPATLTNFSSVEQKMNQVSDNTRQHPNRMSNSKKVMFLTMMRTKLDSCRAFFLNDTYLEMQNKESISPLDVEHFRLSFQSDVLSRCLVDQFYGMTSGEVDDADFAVIAPYVHLTIQNLLSSTSYLEKDLMNNSSYFFNSNHTRMTVHDKTVSGFQTVTNLYNQAGDLLVELSNWYQLQVEGQ